MGEYEATLGTSERTTVTPPRFEVQERRRVELRYEDERTGFEVVVEVFHPSAAYEVLVSAAHAAVRSAVEHEPEA